jgi:peptidoglycan/LPS O-acetylase OafA/YrhL
VHQPANRTRSAASAGAPRPTLAQRFDPRRNSLSVLRLVFAAMVVVTHAGVIGWEHKPELGRTDLGELAVDGFFVVSGFLVVRSGLRLPSLRRFAWHRALRILPGFWVCLVVVAFVAAPLAAWFQGRSPLVVLSGEDSAFRYLLRNAGLLIRQWDVAAVAADNVEHALNGSLWTLWYEALCYAAVAALIAVVPVAWRRSAIGVAVGGVWLFLVAVETGIADGGPEFLPRFGLMFGLGAMGWLFADRVRFTPTALLAAVTTLLAGMVALGDYRAMGAAGFAYLVLWAVVALPLRVEPPADLSYGLYVYHWPVQQVLVAAGATVLGPAGFTLVALGIVVVLAVASWFWVEKPALAFKNAAWVDGGRRRRRVHALL